MYTADNHCPFESQMLTGPIQETRDIYARLKRMIEQVFEKINPGLQFVLKLEKSKISYR